MKCYHCSYLAGAHDPACPKLPDNVESLSIWTDGWYEGRVGMPMTPDMGPAWKLGYLRGEIALEEAQNS